MLDLNELATWREDGEGVAVCAAISSCHSCSILDANRVLGASVQEIKNGATRPAKHHVHKSRGLPLTTTAAN
jgi:hypothetical protein